MADQYRIFGAELSPYSVKVRSYFRLKELPHTWIVRGAAEQAEYERYAKIPIIPLVVGPDDQPTQDSTPIIEAVEALHPKPEIHPTDPVCSFLSTLLEEFGDEWGNKWMFHFRWARPLDAGSAGGRIARTMMRDADEATANAISEQVQDRMTKRTWFVGSSEQTAPQIEASFDRAIAQLDEHLSTRRYLFGDRPSFGDLGLWGQLYNAWTDPTPGSMIEARTPNLLAWIHRMCWPKVEGEFEPWSSLEPTLRPFLADQVGSLFVPWTLANEAAIAEGSEQFTVELRGEAWTQKPQKYHAKSLAALRQKYEAVQDKTALNAVLDEVGAAPLFGA